MIGREQVDLRRALEGGKDSAVSGVPLDPDKVALEVAARHVRNLLHLAGGRIDVGNVYVSDLKLGVIWKFDRAVGAHLETVIGPEPCGKEICLAGHGGVWSDDPLLGWTDQTGTWNANNGTVLGYIGMETVVGLRAVCLREPVKLIRIGHCWPDRPWVLLAAAFTKLAEETIARTAAANAPTGYA
jgi:hypothetical protein